MVMFWVLDSFCISVLTEIQEKSEVERLDGYHSKLEAMLTHFSRRELPMPSLRPSLRHSLRHSLCASPPAISLPLTRCSHRNLVLLKPEGALNHHLTPVSAQHVMLLTTGSSCWQPVSSAHSVSALHSCSYTHDFIKFSQQACELSPLFPFYG